MRVNPISAEKANENNGSFTPWKAGDYDFTVEEATEEVSKSGNDMIKIKLSVFNADGARRVVFDYLLAGDSGAWKVRHFCEAVGLVQQYENGDLDVNEIYERSGRLRLRVKAASSGFEAGNQVGDYIPMAAAPAKKSAPLGMRPSNSLDDEVPF